MNINPKLEFHLKPGDSIQKVFDSIEAGADSAGIFLAAGGYNEILSYDKPNPLVIQAEPGVAASDCRIFGENCEAFHKDTENRSVLVLGSECARVELRGFTIENTHVKTLPSEALGNQAEALCWHNRTGALVAERMRLVSRQDTVHVKGYSFFRDCYIEGDVDFIWGYCHTSLFENCRIHTRADNRGDAADFDAYVLQSRALNSAPGFIFKDCAFTADRREHSKIYIGRSSGTGAEDSVERWDSVALVNCRLSSEYDAALYTDEGGRRRIFPAGCAEYGWREYGTIPPAAANVRHEKNYLMSEEEFLRLYASREQILAGTPLHSASLSRGHSL